jgi:hypothetical protein
VQLGFEGQELETRTLAFVGYMRMVHSANDPRVRRDHARSWGLEVVRVGEGS